VINGIRIGEARAQRHLDDAITNMKFNVNFDSVKVAGESVQVDFTFTTTYEGGERGPKQIGELKIIGTVYANEDKKSSEEISEAWKSKKTLPMRFAEDVINVVNFECASRGTLFAWGVGMVAPIPLSRTKIQESGPAAK